MDDALSELRAEIDGLRQTLDEEHEIEYQAAEDAERDIKSTLAARAAERDARAPKAKAQAHEDEGHGSHTSDTKFTYIISGRLRRLDVSKPQAQPGV